MSDVKFYGAGPRMSRVVVHNGVAYFSGYVAVDAAGKSVTEQTKDILAQIDASLAEVGSSKSRLLEATIWLSDIGTFAEMNAVWESWIVAGSPPSRATVEARLAGPQYGVEIRVLAAV